MSGLELNKIVGAILLSSLIAMVVGVVANILYKPNFKPEHRGYSVAVTEDTATGTVSKEEIKVDVVELMKTANADSGKEIIKKCISCHSFEKGGANKIGPHLWSIVGKDKATTEGYKYSPAIVAVGGKWDDESLYHFIHKPSKFIPGTKMSFIGLSKPEEIANVIAFLKTLHD